MAYIQFNTNVLHGSVKADPLLGRIRTRRGCHSGKNRHVIDNKQVDTEGVEFAVSILFDLEDVRNGVIESHTKQISELVLANRKSIAKMMFGHIDQMTEATGNIVKGPELTMDLIIDLIEKSEWEFDKNGNHIKGNQAFVFSPEVEPIISQLVETDEHRARMEEIEQRKYEEWKLTRRQRRLVE